MHYILFSDKEGRLPLIERSVTSLTQGTCFNCALKTITSTYRTVPHSL